MPSPVPGIFLFYFALTISWPIQRRKTSLIKCIELVLFIFVFRSSSSDSPSPSITPVFSSARRTSGTYFLNVKFYTSDTRVVDIQSMLVPS